MPKKSPSIPINHFGDNFDTGITIERIAFEQLPDLGDWEQPERHDRHSFFLVEQGRVIIEIDFYKYDIHAPSVIYMHPDQIHRILAFENVTVSAWATNDENLSPAYLKLLQEITPAAPMPLTPEPFVLINDAISLCIKLSERKKDQLYHTLLKDAINALVGLLISFYLEQSTSPDKLSRAELITKAFRDALALDFITHKSPAEYADKLNISASYFNECVKSTTGHPVSYHIQQRVVLEAKRLLYHSNRSLKEIAATLGYEDYPYFSRLFTKVTGMPPLSFRSKNHD